MQKGFSCWKRCWLSEGTQCAAGFLISRQRVIAGGLSVNSPAPCVSIRQQKLSYFYVFPWEWVELPPRQGLGSSPDPSHKPPGLSLGFKQADGFLVYLNKLGWKEWQFQTRGFLFSAGGLPEPWAVLVECRFCSNSSASQSVISWDLSCRMS